MKKINPKHAIFANLEQEKIPQAALEQLIQWFNLRDYGFIKNLTKSEFVEELGLRLSVIQLFTREELYIRPFTGGEDALWKFSCHSNNARFSTFDDRYYATRRHTTSSAIYVEKAEYLPIRHELAMQNLEVLPAFPEHATPENVKEYGDKVDLIFKQQEYLSPIHVGGMQTLLSVNLLESTEKLTEQFARIINYVKKEVGIKEIQRKQKQQLSLSPFMNKKALQYLDILMYCIKPIAHKPAHISSAKNLLRPTSHYSMWQLTDHQIAQMLDKDNLDSEHIKDWRQETYEPKLLNSEYMQQYFSDFNRLKQA